MILEQKRTISRRRRENETVQRDNQSVKNYKRKTRIDQPSHFKGLSRLKHFQVEVRINVKVAAAAWNFIFIAPG
jgi:hypothetical protein